jgi:hypothetical protein
MTNKPRQSRSVSINSLWFGLLAGPVAWSLRLLISYPLVPPACNQGWEIALHAISALFVFVALAGILVTAHSLRVLRHTDKEAVEDWSWQRRMFMAQLGLLLSGIFAFAILVEWSAAFVISPCAVR